MHLHVSKLMKKIFLGPSGVLKITHIKFWFSSSGTLFFSGISHSLLGWIPPELSLQTEIMALMDLSIHCWKETEKLVKTISFAIF